MSIKESTSKSNNSQTTKTRSPTFSRKDGSKKPISIAWFKAFSIFQGSKLHAPSEDDKFQAIAGNSYVAVMSFPNPYEL